MLAVLAASHGVNDFFAGWLLGGGGSDGTSWGRFGWPTVYAALAFAGQLPAAWVIERARRPDRWLAIALALLPAAICAGAISFGTAVVLSGIASALCHVAGGALALQLPRGERAIGWFSAPGIVGLTFGGWLGHTLGNVSVWTVVLPLALLGGWAVLRAHWPVQAPVVPTRTESPFDAHDGLMLLLLLALTLRSVLWDLVQLTALDDPRVLFALALSAGAGKIMGGHAAARRCSARDTSIALLGACFLLELARWHLGFLCAGVAVLQGTIPAAIVELHRTFGSTPARATAYGLGLTVALGGLALPILPTVSAALMALAVATLLLVWRSTRLLGSQAA